MATSHHSALDDGAAADLSRRFRGSLVRPGDASYDAARRIWNGAIDRRPALVARCTGVADVRAAVEFARERGLVAAVRGGGHNVAGTALCDGGIVIDLGFLDDIEVLDEATRRVRIGPGATWGAVAEALTPHGWAITSGDYGGVGVGGLATTGGIGLLGRLQGLTIDHVVAAEVVTADGRIVRTSSKQEPELFWGIRGAGANLGVFKTAENPDAAWKLVEWLSRPDVQTAWFETVNDLPAQQSSWQDEALTSDPRVGVFGTQLESVKIAPTLTTWTQVSAAGDTQIEQIFRGGKSPADAMAELQQTAESLGTQQ